MPRYKTADFEQAIQSSYGIKAVVCQRVGCDYKTLMKWLEKSQKLRDAMRHERQRLVGVAESKLLDQLNKGEWRAIHFALTHLAAEEYPSPTVNLKVDDWRQHLPAGVSQEDAEDAVRQFAAMLQQQASK